MMEEQKGAMQQDSFVEESLDTFEKLRKLTYSVSIPDATDVQQAGLSVSYTTLHNRPFMVRVEGPIWGSMCYQPWIGVFELGILRQLPQLQGQGPATMTSYLQKADIRPSDLSFFKEDIFEISDPNVLAALQSSEEKEVVGDPTRAFGFTNGTLKQIVADTTKIFPNSTRNRAFIRWTRGSESADDFDTWTSLKLGGSYPQRAYMAQQINTISGVKTLSVYQEIRVPALTTVERTELSTSRGTFPKPQPGRYEVALFWMDQRLTVAPSVEINSIYRAPSPPPGSAGPPNGNGDNPQIRRLEELMEWLETEFAKVVGMADTKRQIREFAYDTMIEEVKRQAAADGRAPARALYHMAFLGAPGTGKTTMAKIVGTFLKKLGPSVANEKYAFIENPMELIGAAVGETAPKVRAKVDQNLGGVVVIDEAHELTESTAANGTPTGGNGRSAFGEEALNTVMSCMYPDPKAVFIFCGYPGPMSAMFKKNPGFDRRILYKFTLANYSDEELLEIFGRTLTAMNELVEAGVLFTAVPTELGIFTPDQKKMRNAGLIEQWIRYAKKERNAELGSDVQKFARATAFPDLFKTLTGAHLQKGAASLRQNI
jgi:hypothetical protein